MSDILPAERNRKRPRQAPSSRYAEIVPPGVNVLIVDANEVSLAITEAKLCHFSYTVFTARGVAEGASMVVDRSTNIHLVLAEARLPGTDKFEILDKLGRRSDVVVVILTDEEDKDAMLEALKRGAFLYLLKPIPTVIVTNLWQFALFKKREGYPARLEEKSGADLAAASKEKESAKDKKSQGSSKATIASKMNGRKGKIGKKEKNKEGDGDDPMAKERRPKLVWTLELHERFLQAIEVLGPDRKPVSFNCTHSTFIMSPTDIRSDIPRELTQRGFFNRWAFRDCGRSISLAIYRASYSSKFQLKNNIRFLQKYRIYLKNMEKLAAEKSIMSLAASGMVPSYHPSSSSAVAGEPGVTPMSLGVSSSWAMAPIIGRVSPWLVQSSSTLEGIGPSKAYPGLPKRFNNHHLPTMESLRNEPNSYNPSMQMDSLGINGKSLPTGYKLPVSFSHGVWMKCDGISGLPGSFDFAIQAYGTQDKGCTTVTPSIEEAEEKPWLP